MRAELGIRRYAMSSARCHGQHPRNGHHTQEDTMIDDTTTTAATPDAPATARRPRAHTAGVVLSVVLGAFLLFDVLGKLFQPDAVVEGTEKLGFTTGQATVMGIVLALCLVVWAIPRTAVLGAV